ncbi:putative ribonuclease H-like domain-containing protein [Tanacetum coccineum]
MQEELLQFKLQKVWTLVDLPKGKRAIGTKWVYRNKKYERGIVVRNKTRLVAQDYTQEEGIDYDEVFALVARIEAIRLFLAYASFMGFIVYQMDVKSAFLYGTIEEEVYVCQPPGFEDLQFPDNKFINTLIDTNKALLKDEEVEDVDVHLYRSMTGLLMYLIASRPDIIFVVYACASIFTICLGQFSVDDYAGASLDRKSTTRGCQFLGKRLISWQCKSITNIVANLPLKENLTFLLLALDYLIFEDMFVRVMIDEFVDQHNMVACLERTEENAEFLQIISLTEPFNDTYETPKHTKKVFTNMKRKGKDFSGRVTLLFASMLAPPVVGDEGSRQPSEPQPPSSTTQPIIEEQITVTELSSPKNTQSPRQALQKETQLPQTSVPIPNVVDEDCLLRRGMNVVERLLLLTASLVATQASGYITKTIHDKLTKEIKRLEKALRARTPGMNLFTIGTSRRKGLDKENVSRQGRKSHKTKPITAGPSNGSAAGPSTSTTGDIFEDEMTTIADTLVAIRSARPRTTSIVIRNVEEEPRRATPVPIMDEELAQRLFKEEQAQFEREQRIARERAAEQEAKDAALIEQMEVVQARMDANELLALRLQEQEREQFSIDEQARFLVETIAARKKFFATQRAAEIRNKPPTKTQLRNQMIAYLKHMGNDDSGNKDDSSSKQAESSKNRSIAEHDEESVKKQKLQDDAEKA